MFQCPCPPSAWILVERECCGQRERLLNVAQSTGTRQASRPERDGSALCRLSTACMRRGVAASLEDVRCTCDMRDGADVVNVVVSRANGRLLVVRQDASCRPPLFGDDKNQKNWSEINKVPLDLSIIKRRKETNRDSSVTASEAGRAQARIWLCHGSPSCSLASFESACLGAVRWNTAAER